MSPLLRYSIGMVTILSLTLCGLGGTEANGEVLEGAVFKGRMDDIISFVVKDGNRMKMVTGVLDEHTWIYDEHREMIRAERRTGTRLDLSGVWDVTLEYVAGEIDQGYARIQRMEKVPEEEESKTNRGKGLRERASHRLRSSR